MVLADLEVTIVEPVAMFEWRCNGIRRDGRRCSTYFTSVSVTFFASSVSLERRCPECKTWNLLRGEGLTA